VCGLVHKSSGIPFRGHAIDHHLDDLREDDDLGYVVVSAVRRGRSGERRVVVYVLGVKVGSSRCVREG
jgi:hypothetical protein